MVMKTPPKSKGGGQLGGPGLPVLPVFLAIVDRLIEKYGSPEKLAEHVSARGHEVNGSTIRRFKNLAIKDPLRSSPQLLNVLEHAHGAPPLPSRHMLAECFDLIITIWFEGGPSRIRYALEMLGMIRSAPIRPPQDR